MRRSYPSDISREQFEEIRAELSGAKKATHHADAAEEKGYDAGKKYLR